MIRSGILVAFALLAQSGPVPADTISRPHVVIADAPASTLRASAPLWRHPIDPADQGWVSRGEASSSFAAGADAFYVVSGGEIHAYDARTGHERWHSTDDGYSVPAFGSGLLAALNQQGELLAFSPSSGLVRWSVSVAQITNASPAHGSPLASAAITARAYGTATPVLGGFFVQGSGNNDAFAASVGADGSTFWKHTFNDRARGIVSAVRGDVVYVAAEDDGSHLHDVVTAYRFGPGGGSLVHTAGAGPAEVDDRGAWLSVTDFSGVESLGFGVQRLNLSAVDEREPWIYRPELAGENAFPGSSPVAIEDGYVFGQTHVVTGSSSFRSPIYRYRLAAPDGSGLLVSDDGTWLGGPSRGDIVVERDDGLWILHLRGDDEIALHAMRYDDTTTHAGPVAFDGSLVYVAFSDGRLVALERRTGRMRFDAPHACDDELRGVTVRGPFLVAACKASLAVLARPDAS